MRFTPRKRIDFDGVDDVREGDDEVGGVFLEKRLVIPLEWKGKERAYFVVFVKGQILRPEHNPKPFPLPNATLRLET